MRRLLLATTLAITPAAAQADEASYWDLIDPDVMVTHLINTFVTASRTQVQLQYEDLTVSILDGVVTMEGIDLLVPRELTGGVACPLRIDAVEIESVSAFLVDENEGTIELRGVNLPVTCFGPQALAAGAFLPGGRIVVPQSVATLAYDARSSALAVNIRTRLEDVAALSVDVAFAYISPRNDGPDTWAEGELRSAAVTLDNLGGFESAQPFLPPEATDPERAAAFVTKGLDGALRGLTAGGPPSDAAQAFTAEMAEGWAAFVTDPRRLVIETGFPASDPRRFGRAFIEDLEDGPLPLIDLLEPVVGVDRAVERDVLPGDLVRRALAAPDALSEVEAREAGLAFLSGLRAPRNLALGVALLEPLAQAGDGEVALALARAQAASDPAAAYAQALAAGPSGAAGLRGLLDALEADLPFATQLRLQDAAHAPDASDLSGPSDELRARAEAHLRGVGAPRSLRAALIYALVAAGRGDPLAQSLLGRVERAVPGDGAEQWAAVVADAEALALDAWLAGQ